MFLRTRLSRIAICSFTFATLLTTLSAQQPKVLAPHKPIPPKAEKQVKWLSPATQRSMVGGLWMTDPDFKSSIYIKNIVETDPVTVTPILHLSNGAKYTLPEVTIKPADLAIISINDELQKKGISSWATLSGYVELQYLWPWNPFCATVRDVDVSHSLIFTYPLRSTAPPPAHLVKPISPPPTNTVEGMWWKQEKNVTGFIAVANLASQPANTTVEISDSNGLPISQHNITVTPHGMKLIRLPELQATEAVQGGVRIVSSETSDNLVINGGLEDQTTGYSASIPFASEPVGLDAPEHHTIAELGLMTGAADPMMLFPAGATFTPYTILRNVSDTQLTITPTLWWMAGGKPHSAALPPMTVEPLQTESLNVPSLLTLFGPKNFNGSFNISFDTIARRASLVMSAGSVDQTGNYVFEIIPRGVSEGVSRSLQQWSTGNGDDTMITIWNPADEAQDFVFTLFFEDGHYLLPLHMEARETRAFNVSEILQNQVPDAEGNLIPPSIHQGTAKIAGSRAENEYILVAVDFGIYNVRKATCFSGCTTCDGYTDFAIDLLDFTMVVTGTQQETALGTYNTGVQYNLTAATNWTSNDSSVYTVSGGLVTGHASGSATTTGTDPNVPYPMEACGQANCQETQMSNSAQGTVQVPTDSRIVSQISSYAMTTTSSPACPSGQAGWYRQVQKIVTDQNTPPGDITADGSIISESLGLTSTNQLNLASPNPFAPVATSGGGYFNDQFGFCSPLCPGSSGQTDLNETFTDKPSTGGSYNLKTHTLAYTCTGDTDNGK